MIYAIMNLNVFFIHFKTFVDIRSFDCQKSQKQKLWTKYFHAIEIVSHVSA